MAKKETKRFMVINMADLLVVDTSVKANKKAQTSFRVPCTMLAPGGAPQCTFDSKKDLDKEVGVLVARDPNARYGLFECIGVAEPKSANFSVAESCDSEAEVEAAAEAGKKD